LVSLFDVGNIWYHNLCKSSKRLATQLFDTPRPTGFRRFAGCGIAETHPEATKGAPMSSFIPAAAAMCAVVVVFVKFEAASASLTTYLSSPQRRHWAVRQRKIQQLQFLKSTTWCTLMMISLGSTVAIYSR
jgi:hypothetical protein